MEFTRRQDWKEMNLLYREFDQLYHGLSAAMGLSDSAFLILYFLCDNGEGCLQRDICRACSLSKQTVNSSVRRLEQDGIVTFQRRTGRDQPIFLTEKGKRMAEEKIMPVMAMENRALEKMEESESRMLLELTRKYMAILGEMAGNLKPAGKQAEDTEKKMEKPAGKRAEDTDKKEGGEGR